MGRLKGAPRLDTGGTSWIGHGVGLVVDGGHVGRGWTEADRRLGAIAQPISRLLVLSRAARSEWPGRCRSR